MVRKYLDKGGVFETKGTFEWNESRSAIILTDLRDKITTYYAVGDGNLIQLDMQGNKITGELANNYILVKINPLLVGKRWKLVELNGKPVESTEAFLLLDENENTVSGNLGCNTFTGTYELKIGNQIKLSPLAATLKMCLNMETEDELKKVLEIANNYNVSEKSLILNRARMAPLAKFENAESEAI
jgi:heat shock protein HslJ